MSKKIVIEDPEIRKLMDKHLVLQKRFNMMKQEIIRALQEEVEFIWSEIRKKHPDIELGDWIMNLSDYTLTKDEGQIMMQGPTHIQ